MKGDKMIEKSQQAQAAAMIKKHLQGQGLQVSASSSSFSMGDSVRIKVKTPDLHPDKRKEISDYCDRFQYGSYNSMEDMYEYSNKDTDLPQSKYVFCEFTQSDECKAAIKADLEATNGLDKWERERLAHQVWQGVWGNFWETWKPATPEPVQVEAVGGAEVQKHYHTKRGFDFWLVVPFGRMEREEFERIRDAAKACGGWYSRKWGKTPGGYAFKAEVDAQGFASDYFDGGPKSEPVPEGETGLEVVFPRRDVAEKLRTLADKMQGDIDNKLNPDRLTNTPKRHREAGNARIEGQHLKRTQTVLRALADLQEEGKRPNPLLSLTTKKAVHELTKSKVDHSGGYYDCGRDSGEPYHEDSPITAAVWALLKPQSVEERDAEALKVEIDALHFSKIPGYFPTPQPVIEAMLERADIQPGETVLEPSAGSGAILDALPDCIPASFEHHHTLRKILKAKGWNPLGSDFMESDTSSKYDKIVMNPPFEKLQDIDHVRRAFEHLSDGGRLVSVMSSSWTFNSVRKAADFREWVESLDGEWVELPAESFKESGTSVNSGFLILDKDERLLEPEQMPQSLLAF